MQNKGRNKIKRLFNASKIVKKNLKKEIKPFFKGRAISSFFKFNKNRFLLNLRYVLYSKKKKVCHFLNFKHLKKKRKKILLKKLKFKKDLYKHYVKSQRYAYKLLKNESNLKLKILSKNFPRSTFILRSKKKRKIFFFSIKKSKKKKKRIFKRNMLFKFFKIVYKNIVFNRGQIFKLTDKKELLFFYLLFYFKKFNLSSYFLLLYVNFFLNFLKKI